MTIIKRPINIALTLTMMLMAMAVLLPTTAKAVVVDRIVAVVNDSIITETELNAAIAIAVGGLRSNEPREYHVHTKSIVLDNLIESSLIKQDAEKIGVEVSELEIDESIGSVLERNVMTQEELIEALRAKDLPYQEYREQIRDELIRVKFMNARFRSRIEIRTEELKEYFHQHIDEYYAEPSIRLAVLLLTDDGEELVQEKLKIIKLGLKGGEEFTELIKQFSDGPTAGQGGDIGYLHENEISPLIKNIAQSLKVGEISKPVRAKKGIYIVQLIDRKDKEPKSFEEVKGQIRSILYKKMMKERYAYWLDNMKRLAFIDVRL